MSSPEQGQPVTFIYISLDEYKKLQDTNSINPNAVYFVVDEE